MINDKKHLEKYQKKKVDKTKAKLIFNAKRLIELREEKGVTFHSMKNSLNISDTVFCKLENGLRKNPRLITVYQLCKYFNVPIEEFVISEDDFITI